MHGFGNFKFMNIPSSQLLRLGGRAFHSSSLARLTHSCCYLEKSLLNCLAFTFQLKLQTVCYYHYCYLLIIPLIFRQGNGFCTEYKCIRLWHRSGSLTLASRTGAWDWNSGTLCEICSGCRAWHWSRFHQFFLAYHHSTVASCWVVSAAWLVNTDQAAHCHIQSWRLCLISYN